jgi:hypothetical protein
MTNVGVVASAASSAVATTISVTMTEITSSTHGSIGQGWWGVGDVGATLKKNLMRLVAQQLPIQLVHRNGFNVSDNDQDIRGVL